MQSVPAGEGVITYRTRLPYQILIYLSSGAIAGVVASLLTRRTPKEKLDHFFRLIRTPVRPGEIIERPCTLPENPLPVETGKLIPVADLEIPMPSRVGLGGFVLAWIGVGAIIWFTVMLTGIGLPD